MGGNVILVPAVAPHHIGDAGIKGIQLSTDFFIHTLVKVSEHFIQHILGGIVGVEFIGIREQIAFQAVFVAAVQALQEPVVPQVALFRVAFQCFHGTNPLVLQQFKDLAAVGAFGNHNGYNRPFRAGGHHAHQGVIVVEGVEVPDAGLDLVLVHGKAGIELKQAGVADESRVVELGGHILNGVIGGNGYGYLPVLPAKGQHIRRADPGHPAQGDADGQGNGNPYDGHQNVGNAQQTFASPVPGAALFGGVGL